MAPSTRGFAHDPTAPDQVGEMHGTADAPAFEHLHAVDPGRFLSRINEVERVLHGSPGAAEGLWRFRHAGAAIDHSYLD